MFYVVALIASSVRDQVREIFHLARTDPLTGLANRYALRQAVEREVARARRYGLHCGVIIVEIDRFKRFNDRFGHLHGDEVLRRVAATLRGSCREEAARVAERIRSDMEEFSLLRGFSLTVSIGLSAFTDDGLSARDLLEAADAAMYGAKSAGGNTVRAAAGGVRRSKTSQKEMGELSAT